MKQYVCSVCSYTYDESKGIPEAGIAPGTRWEDLPADWKCPWCGAGKESFSAKEEIPSEPVSYEPPAKRHSEKELSPMEMSIICSNLARGCEKQYQDKEAALFRELADFFAAAAPTSPVEDLEGLLALIQEDLERGYPALHGQAKARADRGTQRICVWGEKVTGILNSLLRRYQKEGEAFLQNTNVWVCTVCGFLFVGDEAPALCPVCKVPAWKFEKVEGRG